MKTTKAIVTLCILLSFNCCDDKNKISIKEINQETLTSFINEKVGDVLNKIKERPIEYTYIHEPPSVLRGCYFLYEDGIYIAIYINDFKFIKQINPDYNINWNIDDFYKETISQIYLKKEFKNK